MTVHSLPVGFKFRPTDEELVDFYLRHKISGTDFSIVKTEDRQWFLFCPTSWNFPMRNLFTRATQQGYWKTTGKERQVYSCSNLIGMKRTLVFYLGRPPMRTRTNWIMHEYRRISTVRSPFFLYRLFNKDGSTDGSNCAYNEPNITVDQQLQEVWEDSFLAEPIDEFFSPLHSQVQMEFGSAMYYPGSHDFSNTQNIHQFQNNNNAEIGSGNNSGSGISIQPDNPPNSPYHQSCDVQVPSLNPLPLGLSFEPSDKELVDFYLQQKINGNYDVARVIREINVYNFEPWDLPRLSIINTKDQEWFFFSPLDMKYPHSLHLNRATKIGYWKVTGMVQAVKSGPNLIGMKKTLVFYMGRIPKGTRTKWFMHVYLPTLDGTKLGQSPIVLCRLFAKNWSTDVSDCVHTELGMSSPTTKALIQNHLKDICSDHLQMSSHLPVGDSFFDKLQVQDLTVLDLSNTSLEILPKSVVVLYNLKALLLRKCRRLREVPSLAALKMLVVLDLCYSGSIEKVPEGLESLSNLKYLNLYGTGLKEFPVEILEKLIDIQFLASGAEVDSSFGVEVEDLAQLRVCVI